MDFPRGEKRKHIDVAQDGAAYPTQRAQRGVSPRSRQKPNKQWSQGEQARLNKLQEDDRHREFLAKEGQFVLQQKRKAAEIRVRDGRSRPVDRLVVNLKIIDPIKDLLNDDTVDEQGDYINPEDLIATMSSTQLSDVQHIIDEFLDLERNSENRRYWKAVRVICKEHQKANDNRSVRPVSSDIDKLLHNKSLAELERLESQIRTKLESDEPIDVDYWQHLLDTLQVYKARAQLKTIFQKVLDTKLDHFKREQETAAIRAISALDSRKDAGLAASRPLDPPASLTLAPVSSVHIIDEEQFLADVASERDRIIQAGYIANADHLPNRDVVRTSAAANVDTTHRTTSLLERDVANGFEEDEEAFAGEEKVETKDAGSATGKYRLRKPRYFNRVQMGYEWNKYNQTHYDHENPPPKVVQGYKFHIFYPDLIDSSRAPTYKIIREGGRKRGETVAPAGEEDTCIIRFMSGPPYEDVAFRIVDRDWDYSARHDRGFKSTFDNGILTLHFSFKKVYYRK